MDTLPALDVSAFTAVTALGRGRAAHSEALRQDRSGLTACNFETARLPTWTGEVACVDDVRLPEALRAFDCRNNRLALLGLQQDGFEAAVQTSRDRFGPARVGVFLGSTTAGILETEIAYRQRDPGSGALPARLDYRRSHNIFSVSEFVRLYLRLSGPAATVCTGCSSSAKAFGSAQRMIAAGLIDAAVVGGVDSLCLTALYGFHSLGVLSRSPCRPFDTGRDGISIGEAAAFALLTRPGRAGAVRLLGVGEASDGHHMSAPHPEGLGARQAILRALAAAEVAAGDIDYISLHGTATPANDAAEALAVAAVFDPGTPCSSTKGATGHALGAAGAVEAVISAIAIVEGLMPGSPGTRQPDASLLPGYRVRSSAARVDRVLSNSFGFGGSNCSLVLGRGGA
jgi:3-oxoacyl-[acyl-carrier-protein] synthase I